MHFILTQVLDIPPSVLKIKYVNSLGVLKFLYEIVTCGDFCFLNLNLNLNDVEKHCFY